MVFHPGPGKPPVGDHVVEAGHHFRLGHRGQAVQVSQLEPGRIEVPEAAGVERGALDRLGQQRPMAPVWGLFFGRQIAGYMPEAVRRLVSRGGNGPG
ncbi:MAG: hypothetical protein M3072_02460 [Candidatus Dormibacteraeota bacterium]|nr:hypothetical protein [Candidatus Dormibacteraeota bacterium]